MNGGTKGSGKVAYNSLISSQLIHAPQAGWTQDMPEATHTQAPPCEQFPVFIHDDANVSGAANGL